jgi:hypothetical protein
VVWLGRGSRGATKANSPRLQSGVLGVVLIESRSDGRSVMKNQNVEYNAKTRIDLFRRHAASVTIPAGVPSGLVSGWTVGAPR